MSNLLAVNGLTWPVAISDTHMQIGCQVHPLEDWEAFSDSDIARMEERALDFWKAHKKVLMRLAKLRRKV